VAGGVLGTILGFAGMRALLAISPAGLPRIGENGSAISIDWRVLGFTLGVSLLTGILFGLFPAFSASRSDLNSTLKESGSRSGTGLREGKARSLLVVSEFSLALVLLIGAALLIRTFIALHEVGPGFDAHYVLTMEMSLNGPRYQNTAGLTQLLRDGRNRLNALPGVEIAAAGFWRPIDVEDGTGGFHIVGRLRWLFGAFLRQRSPSESSRCSARSSPGILPGWHMKTWPDRTSMWPRIP
jgi:hypothetical protein